MSPSVREWHLFIAVNLMRAVATDVSKELSVLTFQSNGSAPMIVWGLFASFSHSRLPSDEASVWAPTEDTYGCASYAKPSTDGLPFVVLAQRGSCTFVQKTLRAQAAGAVGIIVADNSSKYFLMGDVNETQAAATIHIFSVGVPNVTGDWLLQQSRAHETVTVSVQAYEKPYTTLTQVCLVALGTTLVALGAFFATADLRPESIFAPQLQELAQNEQDTSVETDNDSGADFLEIDNKTAAGFVLMGSCMLVVLFYFMWLAIYFVIAGFCIGGTACLSQICSAVFQHFCVSSRRIVAIPCIGRIPVADIIATILAAGVVCVWLVYRDTSTGWLFQDIIGAGFLCAMQRTLRLPNLQVATLLLSAMFCYDVFWVFISPLLFSAPAASGSGGHAHHGTSVMVNVAQGGGTGQALPMLLRVPVIGDIFGTEQMLGFGDIALPGFLISYLLRQDTICKRSMLRGYFLPGVIAYAVGLGATMAALMIMQIGQPALLYLVPCTLGTTSVLALCRGEFWFLWEGHVLSDKSASGSIAENLLA